jgi:prolyl 4-hydroxylase
MQTVAVMSYSGDRLSDNRTNRFCWLEKKHDPVVHVVCRRIAELVEMPLTHAEKVQVVHYAPGEEFKPHFDAIRPVSVYTQERIQKMGGQRLVTALVYLNQVKAGGETYFPKLGVRQVPEPMSMLVFSNVREGRRLPDPLSEHGAAAVLEGEKWAFNLWFRERETGL